LDVPALLRAYQLRPKKGLGQNFLVDPGALLRVAAAAEIGPEDVVLEIGPGLGSLTRYLARSARRVVQGDILDLDPAELVGSGAYKVAANIPYYITSAVIRHLLDLHASDTPVTMPARPERLALTVQREVAQRIVARPGEMNLLALSVQVFGAPRVVATIPAGAFYPVPDVDSSVVRIDLYPQPVIAVGDLDRFFTLTRAGFSQKRKKLRNALSAGLSISTVDAETRLRAAGIDPGRRAETLSLEEWKRLVSGMVESSSPALPPNSG
jgi:16S rRNA (adenine1518-N6/adenine1519-N6)-dimethyltransferase